MNWTVNNNICECDTGFYKIEADDICSPTCPDGFYADPTAKKCNPCSDRSFKDFCLTCTKTEYNLI